MKYKKEDCEVQGGKGRKLEFQKCRNSCYDQFEFPVHINTLEELADDEEKDKEDEKDQGSDNKLIQCLTDTCFNEFLTEECAKCKQTCHLDNVTEDEEGNSTFFFGDVRKCMRNAGCIMSSRYKKEDCEVQGGKGRKLEFQKCRNICYDQFGQ